MSTFDLLADLPIEVDGYSLEGLQANVSSGFERLSTVVHLTGGGLEGVGEDVVYDAEDHVALQNAGAVHSETLSGRFTLAEFCELVDALDLFPVAPKRDVSRLYRRWTFHSAALDLALAQAGQPLWERLGREPRPLTFVVSLRLGEPPTLDPLERRLAHYPSLRFKLDPTSSWTPELIEALVATGAVDSVDFKSLYTRHDRRPAARPGAVPARDRRVPERVDRGSRRGHARDRGRPGRRARPDHVGRADSLDRRHRGAAVPAAHGQPQAVAHRRAGEAVRDVRLLRRTGYLGLQRRAV